MRKMRHPTLPMQILARLTLARRALAGQLRLWAARRLVRRLWRVRLLALRFRALLALSVRRPLARRMLRAQRPLGLPALPVLLLRVWAMRPAPPERR